MSWIIYCFIAILFTVTYSLISKKILSHKDDHDPVAYASTLFVGVAGYSFIFYLISGAQSSDFANLLSSQVLPILILNVVLYSIAPSLYYRALKRLPASEVTILYALTGIYTLILGVTLGMETFFMIRLVGAIFILLSTVLVSFKEGKWKINKYMGMMFVATLVYAAAAITDKIIISKEYFSLLFFQTLSFGIPSILILLINPKSIKYLPKVYRKRTLFTVFLNALFFFISFFAIYNAYKVGGDTSQVNLVMSTETVAMVIFAAIFLNERKHLFLKIIAAISATVGIYLLA